MCKRLFDIKLQQVLSVEMALHRGSLWCHIYAQLRQNPWQVYIIYTTRKNLHQQRSLMSPCCKELISQGPQINHESQIYRNPGLISSGAHETAWFAKELQ